MAIVGGIQKPKGQWGLDSQGRFQGGAGPWGELVLAAGAEPAEAVETGGVSPGWGGINSRETTIAVRSTACSRRLEGGQPDVRPQPWGTKPSLFSECGLSALKSPHKGRLTSPFTPHLGDKSLLQVLLALHRTHAQWSLRLPWAYSAVRPRPKASALL